MENFGTSKEIFLEQFLKWWGKYFLFLIAFYVIHSLFGAETTDDIFQIMVLIIGCSALGSLMAVSHYYLIYNKYWHRGRHSLYLVLSICLVALFVLLDNVLFYFQIGYERFSRSELSNLLFVNFERVMYTYVPVVLVYTAVRNRQIYRKETKNR